MANPNWQDKWTPAELEALIVKRRVEGKTWQQISRELGKPLQSCHRRAQALLSALPHIEAPTIATELPLHVQLGIETYQVKRAVTDYVGGFDRTRGQYFSPHEYRAVVTLPRVLS